jgi:hypothetical protein
MVVHFRLGYLGMLEEHEKSGIHKYVEENCGNNFHKEYSEEISMAKTPESIKSHAADYVNHSWEDYTFEELGQFVHLFAKRATHRIDVKKRQKDLYDAQNYLNMMQAKLDDIYPSIPRTRPE